MHIYIYILLSILVYSCTTVISNTSSTDIKVKTSALKEVDGPYIYGTKDSIKIISVKKDTDSSFYIKKEKIKRESNQQFNCNVSNLDNDNFLFSLIDEYKIPKAIYEPQEKIFVTSDLEGNFNAFYSLLLGNKIIDKNFNWIFETGHLVIAGDMVDRGNNVMPCLWLLYKLEQDAKKAGGQVHYVLGNHDVMNIQLDIRYVQPKYIKLAKIISNEADKILAYKYLMANTNELVKWMKTKNAIEKIGNNLFVHGGISEEIVDAELSIQQINDIVRKHIHELLIKNPGNDENANLVFGNKGPLWHRGLVKDYKDYYKKIKSNNLDQILRYYNVDHIIIGHTIVDDEVTSDFNGRVIRVDIKHSNEKFSGKSQALLIEGDKYYKVNDYGERFKLSN